MEQRIYEYNRAGYICKIPYIVFNPKTEKIVPKLVLSTTPKDLTEFNANVESNYKKVATINGGAFLENATSSQRLIGTAVFDGSVSSLVAQPNDGDSYTDLVWDEISKSLMAWDTQVNDYKSIKSGWIRGGYLLILEVVVLLT